MENIFRKTKRENINFLSQQRDWKNSEQNNESIAFNVLFASQNSEEITLKYELEQFWAAKKTCFC